MRVLTAIDLSVEGHEWLMARAGGFANRLGAVVDAVYVCRPDTSDAEKERLLENLEAVLSLVAEPVRGEARCEPGEVVETLVTVARDYDGLVVGPREPGTLEAMLKGSMAARVLRRTPVPVLVPRGRVWPARPLKMLAGVDIGGVASAAVVRFSAQWAERLGGTVDAVYALGDRPPPIKDRAVREKALREWLAAREPDRQELERLLQAIPEAHRGQAMLRPGEADDALVELSKGYDLVVVGNRERQGIARYLLGTVATMVVRNAHCDVLTLPTASLDP